MATIYVDPAATGADNGTSWTDAYDDVQDALTAAVAGDTIYARGTQTLAATATFAAAGSAATGYIKLIGCNASGDVDGTRFALNGNSAVSGQVLSLGTNDFIWLENIECYSGLGVGIGMGGTGQNYLVFINCLARNNGTDGFNFFANGRGWVIGCVSNNNGLCGFDSASSYPPVFIGCHADGNSNEGFYQSGLSGAVAFGCLATNNTHDGFILNTQIATLINCIADGNDRHGVSVGNFQTAVFGCRLTNNGSGATAYYGLKVNANYRGLHGWTFLKSNKGGATTGTWDIVPFKDDADTNETSGDEGYVNRASGDYNLADGATLRSVAIEID